MNQRHLPGHTEVGRDQPHASQHQERAEGRPDGESLDGSGDDKGGNRYIGFDDCRGRSGWTSSRWVVGRGGQGEYRSGRGCSSPLGAARNSHLY